MFRDDGIDHRGGIVSAGSILWPRLQKRRIPSVSSSRIRRSRHFGEYRCGNDVQSRNNINFIVKDDFFLGGISGGMGGHVNPIPDDLLGDCSHGIDDIFGKGGGGGGDINEVVEEVEERMTMTMTSTMTEPVMQRR